MCSVGCFGDRLSQRPSLSPVIVLSGVTTSERVVGSWLCKMRRISQVHIGKHLGASFKSVFESGVVVQDSGKLGQEDRKFESSLGNLARPWLMAKTEGGGQCRGPAFRPFCCPPLAPLATCLKCTLRSFGSLLVAWGCSRRVCPSYGVSQLWD